jgi:hypothetical protein
MAAIDVGSAASDRASEYSAAYTRVNKTNPANLTGIITSIEVWLTLHSHSFEVASFYVVSGDNLTSRHNVSIGNVSSGSKQTFDISATPLNINSGDYLGFYDAEGKIEADSTGGSGVWNHTGDVIPCTNDAFTSSANFIFSLYGTGATVPTPQVVGAGAITMGGVLNRKTLIGIGGALTSASTLNRKTKRGVGGVIAPASTLNRKTKRGVGAGAVSMTGTLASLRKFFQAAGAGAVTMSSTLGRKIYKGVGGALPMAGTLGRGIRIAVGSGAATMSGTLGRKIKLVVGAGAVAITGLLNRLIKIFTGRGAVTSAGTLAPVLHIPSGIYIGGVKYSYAEGSLSVDQRLEERSVASFAINDLAAAYSFTDGQFVVISVNDHPIFGGILEAPDTERLEADTAVRHTFRAADWHYLADKRIAAASYESQTCGYIVQELITNYLAGEGITVGEIQAGPTITEAIINYARVSDALEALALKAGFTWWIDQYKKLWFIDRATYVAPWAITTAEIMPGSAKLNRANPTYRNRQYLRGPTSQTSLQTETRQGDGNLTAFTMSYPLNKVPVITLNGGVQTVGIKGLDTGKDWYWSKGDAVIAQDTGGAVLISTDVLSVAYYGQFPMIILSEDIGEVLARQAIEGGTGIIEDIADAVNVTTEAAGFELAAGYLRKYCQNAAKFTFQTRREGLMPGQMATVTHGPLGLAAEEMLISSVQMQVSGGSKIVYSVTALQGPVLGAWSKFFKTLTDKSINIDLVSVGSGGTLTLIVTKADTTNWSESIAVTLGSCPLCSVATICGAGTIVC